MHMMNDMCLCNAFKDLEHSKFFVDKKGTHIILIRRNSLVHKCPMGQILQNDSSRQKNIAHPLWCDVGVEIPLLVQ